LFFGIWTAGCKSAKTVDPEKENEIRFDTLQVRETYHLLGDSANPYCTLESSFIYPSEYNDKKALDKLTRHFIQTFFGEDETAPTPKDAMDQYVEKYMADYRELESDFKEESEITGKKPPQESWYAYYEISFNEIIYNKRHLVSYTVAIEYYTGGAHGGHGYNHYVLSLETGDDLNEDDIFKDDYQNELARLIVDAIAADHHMTTPEDLENIGYFNVKEIYPNNNFYVNGDGITYTFNEYEIAAYYVGKIDVFLPYDKIRHLMREDSPVAPLAFTPK
jgi:hypothetical protein